MKVFERNSIECNNGFLSSLDPNSKVFNKNFKSADKVKIQGVGLLLRKENSKIIVEAVLETQLKWRRR